MKIKHNQSGAKEIVVAFNQTVYSKTVEIQRTEQENFGFMDFIAKIFYDADRERCYRMSSNCCKVCKKGVRSKGKQKNNMIP